MALFRTLPTPTNDLLSSLMVEVCLVLAPDVNFFLNSHARKKGLPCWHSLSILINPQQTTKLAFKLHTHSVQYAYELVRTRRALEKNFATVA